jgi:hypothetical protein
MANLVSAQRGPVLKTEAKEVLLICYTMVAAFGVSIENILEINSDRRMVLFPKHA